MMKKFVLCLLSLCFSVLLRSHDDPPLLHINGKAISRAEFVATYRTLDHLTVGVNDYLQLFIDRKLKIAEAISLGIDTTPEYKTAILAHENSRDRNFLSMFPTDKHLWAQYCEQQRSLPRAKKVKVMQIFKTMPQNSTSLEQERTIRSMESLYTQLITDTLAGFADYVNRYSEEKRCLEVGWLETSPDFEQTVFGMREGEISKPFTTPSGIHIVKVIAENEIPTEEDLNDSFQSRTMRRYKSGRDLSFLQHLTNEVDYRPNINTINELLTTGYADGTLFTLNGREYTTVDFNTFAEDNPKGVKRQFDDFVVKALFNSSPVRFDSGSSDSANSTEIIKEEFLISNITRRMVTDQAQDKAGLKAYFSVHKKKYQWDQPRFKGVVLHVHNKQQFRSAKKLIRKMPFEDWKPIITQYLNAGDKPQVEVEQGIFASGDNDFVDELVFKRGHASPHPFFPYTFVIGKKIKGPESYDDAIETVLPDYESFLEKRWVRLLRDRHRVEINEEVLKTVNYD